MNLTKFFGKRDSHGVNPVSLQKLLSDLVMNDLLLIGLFLTAADAAANQSDSELRAELLGKALRTYQNAASRLSELPDSHRENLEDELGKLREQLQTAYSDDTLSEMPSASA